MRLLDLYCGAGGSAEGYSQAGFTDIVGVDSRNQRRYPFNFYKGDAIAFAFKHGHEFDAIHASPPCQAYSVTRTMTYIDHPQLIEPTRRILIAMGKPYVIENVPGAPLLNPIVLCGTMFWLKVYRHRLFESNVPLIQPYHGKHWHSTGSHRGYSKGYEFVSIAGNNYDPVQGRAAMQIPWMTREELSQAIPPLIRSSSVNN